MKNKIHLNHFIFRVNTRRDFCEAYCVYSGIFSMSSSVCNRAILDVIFNMAMFTILNYFCGGFIIKIFVPCIGSYFFTVISASEDDLIDEAYNI